MRLLWASLGRSNDREITSLRNGLLLLLLLLLSPILLIKCRIELQSNPLIYVKQFNKVTSKPNGLKVTCITYRSMRPFSWLRPICRREKVCKNCAKEFLLLRCLVGTVQVTVRYKHVIVVQLGLSVKTSNVNWIRPCLGWLDWVTELLECSAHIIKNPTSTY